MVGFLGILLFEILNTYSRGAYLALGVIVFLALWGQRHNPYFWFVGISTAVLALAIMPASYIERFRSLILLVPGTEGGIYQESSFRGRSSEMLTGLSMFAANPLLGVGAGNYPNNYQEYTQFVGLELRSGERDPHSLYVQILAETGIVGAIAFAGLSVFLLLSLHRSKQSIEHLPIYESWGPWISAIQLTVIGYLLISLFLHGAYLRYFWIFVALAISAIQLTDEALIGYEQTPSQEILT
jgi:O-antigen ligase